MDRFKFRAWDEKFNVMIPGVSVYDDQNIIVVDVTMNEVYGDRLDDRWEAGIEEAGPEHVCITGGIVIMQFTGLKDKAKKEIYEGDKLINPTGEIGVVVFYEGGFYLECPRKSGQPFYVAMTNGFVANKLQIGNIYEQEGPNE